MAGERSTLPAILCFRETSYEGVPDRLGVTFFHQMIPIEIGPGGFVAVTATNALQLQAGMF